MIICLQNPYFKRLVKSFFFFYFFPQAKADPFVVNSMLNWVNLPNPKIPLVFHGVVGDDQREAKSPSYFNPEECAMVKYLFWKKKISISQKIFF